MKDITREIKKINKSLQVLGEKNNHCLQVEEQEIEKLKFIIDNLFIKD